MYTKLNTLLNNLDNLFTPTTKHITHSLLFNIRAENRKRLNRLRLHPISTNKQHMSALPTCCELVHNKQRRYTGFSGSNLLLSSCNMYWTLTSISCVLQAALSSNKNTHSQRRAAHTAARLNECIIQTEPL